METRIDMSGMVETTRWAGTATYRRTQQATNPDGSRLALYDLTAMTLQRLEYGTDSPDVTCTVPDSPGPGTVKAGDLEIQVSRTGAWTSALLVDVVGAATTMTCVTKTNPPVTSTSPFTAKAFLNTRMATGGLRAMKPSGHVVATGVTDFMAVAAFPGASGTASWDPAPIG